MFELAPYITIEPALPGWAEEYKAAVLKYRGSKVQALQNRFPELLSCPMIMSPAREKQYSMELDFIQEEFSEFMKPLARINELIFSVKVGVC
jgi:hypothetical protein